MSIALSTSGRATGWALHPLAVRPDRQRTGIGRALLGALEAELASRGATVVYLGTDDETGVTLAANADESRGVGSLIDALNDPNADDGVEHPYIFYRRNGYRVCGIVPHANGRGLPDIMMCKTLATWEITDALDRYRGRYPHEAATVDRLLELATRGEPAFRRTHAHAHFTASAVVLDPQAERVLLTHHRKLDIWIQLGGHADGDRDLRRAATREAEEESGLASIHLVEDEILDVDIHPIPAHGAEPPHDHYDVRFLFEADPDDPLTVSDESHDLAWVQVDELMRFSHEESLHRAVRKAVARRRAQPSEPSSRAR